MVIQVVEFSSGGKKLGRLLPKNQHTQRKSLNFENWCQKVPTFDFQSQFSMSKIIRIFLIFFHWKIPIPHFLLLKFRILSIYEHIFCYWQFLITSIFKSLYFLKWCPIFDSSPLLQFSKFNNFLWVCWFLAKNLAF